MWLVSWCLVLAPMVVAGYAYVGYPALLALLARRRRPPEPLPPAEWPTVSITVPAYNEEQVIAGAIDGLLALDYPEDRRRIIVVSDASTDATDQIVQGYASRGVTLVRLAHRSGKTAAENAARGHVAGDIVVNTDASVRLDPASLKPLVAAFRDPTVGVASGRDVSVGQGRDDANTGESVYVDYEMRVRDLETAVYGIVGASGCYYASRVALHGEFVPDALSRDFAAPLIARKHGYRSVSVPEARCYVPRTASLRREYRRKVRTMVRGLQTLHSMREVMNPLRYGRFAWMVVSHKLVRWIVPWTVICGALGMLGAAVQLPWLGRWVLVGGLYAVATATLAWSAPNARLPRAVTLPAYLVWGTVAGLHAWMLALRGERAPTWEPTRREAVMEPAAPGGPPIGARR